MFGIMHTDSSFVEIGTGQEDLFFETKKKKKTPKNLNIVNLKIGNSLQSKTYNRNCVHLNLFL